MTTKTTQTFVKYVKKNEEHAPFAELMHLNGETDEERLAHLMYMFGEASVEENPIIPEEGDHVTLTDEFGIREYEFQIPNQGFEGSNWILVSQALDDKEPPNIELNESEFTAILLTGCTIFLGLDKVLKKRGVNAIVRTFVAAGVGTIVNTMLERALFWYKGRQLKHDTWVVMAASPQTDEIYVENVHLVYGDEEVVKQEIRHLNSMQLTHDIKTGSTERTVQFRYRQATDKDL